MKACVLVRTEPGKYGSTARQIAKLQGVKAVFPVYGRTDVVAAVEAKDVKSLSKLSRSISNVKGVLATETLVGLEV